MSTLKVDAIRHNSATSDAITTAADGTCTAKLTSVNGGQLSHRNIIINGAMTVAQRSSGTVAVSDGSNESYQTLDRFKFGFGNSAAGAANISQSTDAPTTLGFTKSHKTDVTTVNTTASGQQVIQMFYRIEGQDIRNSGWNHLSSSSFLTLSFYFKTTKTGTSKLPIMFRTRHGTNYYYVKNVTVTDPTNWNRYTVKVPGNSNLTINDLTTSGMSLNITYYSGPDKDTSSEGSWGSTNAYSTSESTNYFDSTSNDMFITGVQLEVGETATSFEHRSFADEIQRCQRYYEKSYKYADAPGTSTDSGSVMFLTNRSPGTAHTMLRYMTRKRAAPTLVSYDPTQSNTTGMRNLDANATYSYSMNRNGETGCTAYPSGSLNLGQFIQFHYTADAEL